jgi:protocatechuate 3,4-dioxygenase beta subunit
LLATGGYFVSAEAAGFSPASAAGGQPIFIAWGESKMGLDMVLSRGGAKLAGLVLDATGGPVAGAAVRVTRVETTPHNTVAVETGHDGRFALWTLPGPVTWMAEAVGYAPLRGYRVAPTGDLVIQLTPASTVQGEVVAARDGTRVPEVEVRAVPQGSWYSPFHRSGVTNSEGAFTIQGLEPGPYIFVGEGAGWRGQSAAPLGIGLGQHFDHVVVTVSPVAQVAGTVLFTSTGQPCRQGSVGLGPTLPGMTSPYDPPYAKPENGNSHVASLMSSIEYDGGVHFRAVPPGTYHVVVQCADHLLSAGPTTLDVGSANVDGVVWKVEPGLRMVIHFVDGADQPVAGARGLIVFPARREGERRMPMGLLADANGRFEYPGALYPGTYTLRPDAGYEGNPVEVELREGMGKVDATLRLVGRGSVLVTVQTPEAEPIDDVTVSATAADKPSPSAGATGLSGMASPSTPANPSLAPPSAMPLEGRTFDAVPLGNGRFRIGPLAPGRFQVRVSDGVNPPPTANGSRGGLVSVGTGVVQMAVTLERNGSIRGRIVDASNQPLPDVWVSADCQQEGASTPLDMLRRHPPPGYAASGGRVVSDPEGRFTLRGLAHDAPCKLRAEQPNGSIGLKRDARSGDDVVISLPALGTLSGSAFTANGDPVERFTISVNETETGGRARGEMVSAPGGHWTLGKVQPGTLEISANAEGAFAAFGTVLAPGQALGDVRLEFRPVRETRSPPAAGPGSP